MTAPREGALEKGSSDAIPRTGKNCQSCGRPGADSSEEAVFAAWDDCAGPSEIVPRSSVFPRKRLPCSASLFVGACRTFSAYPSPARSPSRSPEPCFAQQNRGFRQQNRPWSRQELPQPAGWERPRPERSIRRSFRPAAAGATPADPEAADTDTAACTAITPAAAKAFAFPTAPSDRISLAITAPAGGGGPAKTSCRFPTNVPPPRCSRRGWRCQGRTRSR